MRTELFWVITQRVAVIYYRRFGTTCRSHFQGSRITVTRCLITQKGTFLTYFAWQDWNYAMNRSNYAENIRHHLTKLVDRATRRPGIVYPWDKVKLKVDCLWNVMAHAQKPDFVFRQNGRVQLNQWGCQYSRLLSAELCASAVVMLDTPCSEVVWRVLDTHSIRQFPLHFPSRASPCAITFQLDSKNFPMSIYEDVWGHGSLGLRFPNPGTRWMWLVN
jgi:hypothetical protein